MNAALGFKAHSGWAVAVAVGLAKREFEVIDRRRVELIEEGELWAKQPYHAAQNLPPGEARELVNRGVASAHRVTRVRLKEMLDRYGSSGFSIVRCAVVMPERMPEWTTDEILAVHFRMHKAEGVLFPEAVCRAAVSLKLDIAPMPEKHLAELAVQTFGRQMDRDLKDLGQHYGPPWTKDHRSATLAAMIALTS